VCRTPGRKINIDLAINTAASSQVVEGMVAGFVGVNNAISAK
jgi:hypothetical protein